MPARNQQPTPAPKHQAQDERLELSPELVRRLKAREPEALGILFDHYLPRIYRYVHRAVADDHTAEDLTQEVFLNIQRSLPSFDERRALDPWIFTIATNKVRDHWRSRRHVESAHEASIERDAAADFVAAEIEPPDRGLVRREMARELRAAIDELSEKNRETLVLRAFEGLSFDAIGRTLGRSEVAVRKRYSRALESLRTLLAKPAGQGA